jgi:hypothetical protein
VPVPSLVVEPAARSEWDEFVAGSRNGTLFHTSRWLDHAELPWTPWVCRGRGGIVGGLPVCEKRVAGVAGMTHPVITPYLGLVLRVTGAAMADRYGEDKEVGTLLAEKIAQAYRYVRINFAPGVVDLQPFAWAGFAPTVRYTYLLDVRDLDAVWRGMADNRRRSIRAAARAGHAVVRAKDAGDVAPLLRDAHGRAGLSPRVTGAILRYWEALAPGGCADIFVARDGHGEPQALVFVVRDGRRAYYLGGGTARAAHHGAAALAIWEGINDARNVHELMEFDFEGSSLPGIEAFFRRFGGVLTPVFSVRRSPWWFPALAAVRRMVAR